MKKKYILIIFQSLLFLFSPGLMAAQKAVFYPVNPLTSANIYCVSDTRLQCFNAQTQLLLWQNKDIKSARGMVLSDGKLFINRGHVALMLDAQNGKELSEWDNKHKLFDPVVTNNHLILSDQQGWLRVIDLDSRETKWSRKVESSWIYPPAVIGSLLISGGRDGKLSAVDIETGSPLWQTNITQEIVYRPVEATGKIFVSSFDGYIRVIEPSNGDIISTIHLGSAVFDIKSDGNDKLLAAGYDGTLYAIDTQTGSIRWQRQVADSQRFSFNLNDQLISSIDYQGKFYLINKTDGKLIKESIFAGIHHVAPLMTSSIVRLFPSDKPVINILNP